MAMHQWFDVARSIVSTGPKLAHTGPRSVGHAYH